jgi:uncharacterized protein (DUF927 family)
MTLDRADLFKGDGGGIIDRLASAGMDLRFSGANGRGEMLDLLRSVKSDTLIPVAPRPGWTRDRTGRVTGFLLPTGEYIKASGPDMRLHSTGMIKDRQSHGTLEGWQTAANAAHHNTHWQFALCAGFAGPLLDLIEAQPSGFNFSGESSLGKTLALLLGTTIWTSGANGAGVFYVMNGTSNALEDIATMCSGTFMALDEIGAMQNPAALGSMLFGLSSATGKNRKAGRGAGLAETAEFRTVSITTNERSLMTAIKDAGGDYKTGLSVRFPDIDVTNAKRVSADVLAELDHAKDNFGHAGPAFIRFLIAQGWHDRADELKARINKVAERIAGEKAAPPLRRAARAFALVQVAGGFAAQAGLIKMAPVLPAVKSAFNTFKQSDEGRATSGSESMLDGLRSWIVKAQGSGRIIEADDADASGYKDVVGWHTADTIILDYESLSDMKTMGLSGKRDGLLAALSECDALERSGKNRFHNSLPSSVKGDPNAPAKRRVRNVRIKRKKLGV